MLVYLLHGVSCFGNFWYCDNIFLHSEVATFHWSKVSRKVGIVESILSAVSLCWVIAKWTLGVIYLDTHFWLHIGQFLMKWNGRTFRTGSMICVTLGTEFSSWLIYGRSSLKNSMSPLFMLNLWLKISCNRHARFCFVMFLDFLRTFFYPLVMC